MKKLMRKLVLSCFALGLAVVTLTTTTFAWYTANSEVSATGIQGTTKGEVDGSLEISLTGADGSWGPTVELSSTSYKNGNDGTEMVPLQLIIPTGENSEGALYTLDPDNALNKYQGVAASQKSYIEFDLYVRNSTPSSDPTEIYLKELIITNTKANENLPVKNQLVDNGIGGMSGVLGGTYTVDAVRALSMTFTSHENTTGNYIGSNRTRYSISECQTGLLPGSGVVIANADAVAYYNEVMNPNDDSGKDIVKTDYAETNVVSNGANAIKLAEIAATSSNYTIITIKIWLEGWDNFCFDACQDQSFNISLKLTSKADDCLIGTN